MDNIYVIRERIEAVYGKHSKSFDKAFQFILAMITFTMINQNTGFMKSLSSPVISLGLAESTQHTVIAVYPVDY